MSQKELSRRTFLTRASALGLVAVGSGAILSACGGGDAGSDAPAAAAPEDAAPEVAKADACSDLTGLTDDDLKMRETLQYVEETPDATKTCVGCQLYTDPVEGAGCGGCQIIKGPIAANGYCVSWAARVS